MHMSTRICVRGWGVLSHFSFCFAKTFCTLQELCIGVIITRYCVDPLISTSLFVPSSHGAMDINIHAVSSRTVSTHGDGTC